MEEFFNPLYEKYVRNPKTEYDVEVWINTDTLDSGFDEILLYPDEEGDLFVIGITDLELESFNIMGGTYICLTHEIIIDILRLIHERCILHNG